MRAPVLALSWSLGTMLALQSPIHAQDAESQLQGTDSGSAKTSGLIRFVPIPLSPQSPVPVSIERIRAGLKQPPPVLQAPAPSGGRPTFRIEVQGRPVVLQPIDEKPFDPTFGLPSAGELLMNGIERIRSAAVDYKRRRAERGARKEVDDALAAFCAVRECSAPDIGK